ncbi:hypothetical protein WHR41_04390 [Cladosporium halotolerans]|uniref:Formate/nitrite transporter n=1 Tax=Cladosporium halotolerans TaxID=1052096 RepID=A0AB34KST2_9PEZI
MSPPPPTNAYTPQQTTELCSRAGHAKARMRPDKVLLSSFLAGAILAFACASTLSVTVAPWYQENAPGVITLLGAAIFPFGLTIILTTGADLCTGSFMLTTISTLHGRTHPLRALAHWTLTFLGNLAGSLFTMALLVGYTTTFSSPAAHARAASFATAKALTPAWHVVFLRGIGANWLVCLAAWLSFMARGFGGKVAAIWGPTFAFVMLGFDHVVANMLYVPLGIFVGAEGLTVGRYIADSMIPALLGNIVGGGLMVGVVYWYLYLCGNETPVVVDGEVWEGDQKEEEIVGQVREREDFEGQRSGEQTPRRKESKGAEDMV